MKNLSLKENAQESPEELATEGYQRRFFNRSPLIVELASAFDQAFAELEQGLTQKMRDQDGKPPQENEEEHHMHPSPQETNEVRE